MKDIDMKDIEKIVTPKNTMLATVLSLVLLTVLLTIGMLTPLVAKLTTGVEMSLDAQYFNTRSALPTAALVILLTICLLIGYFDAKKTAIIAGAAIAASIIFAIVSPFNNTPIDITVPLITVAMAATLYKMWKSIDRESKFKTLRGVSAHIIHFGILMILIGIVISTNTKVEDSNVLGINTLGEFAGQDYSIKVNSMTSGYEGSAFQEYPGSSYVTKVDFDIYKNNKFFDSGQVKYITDFKWGQTYTSHYIKRGLYEELFIAPRAIDEQNQKINLYVRTVPFMTVLWVGMYLMAIGIVILGATEHIKAGRNVKMESDLPKKSRSKPSMIEVQKENVPVSDIEKKYEERLERELMKRKGERGEN
ncbi:MAG: cytochrome c-type biogenesis CcmF C-terminal domain-containing protein [Methanosarcinaceae archaeon]|nr:cytochrome c-type biogenesis CcmF C-terminal domain-containing protein [Methanosarcinaceae archaeon]